MMLPKSMSRNSLRDDEPTTQEIRERHEQSGDYDLSIGDDRFTNRVMARHNECRADRGILLDRVDELEAKLAALTNLLSECFSAIESLDIDALGVVPETHDHPAFPIRDELLHKISPRAIGAILEKDNE